SMRRVVVVAASAAVLFGLGSGGVEPAALPAVQTTSTTLDLGVRWRTVWSDDFDGDHLDTSRWTAEHSTFGDGNHELQCYEPSNVAVAGGRLMLTAHQGPATCPHGRVRRYASGMVRSRAAWAYGAFEVRARVPAGIGMLPAVWLLPTRYPYGRRGRSGELDVVEVSTADPGAALVTAHWSHADCGWGCRRYGRRVPMPSPRPDQAFHTYRLEWGPRRLTWFIDGVPVYELGDHGAARWGSAAAAPAPGSATYPAPFDDSNPMYLLINLAVGGDLPGPPDGSTVFPASFEIESVRVQRTAG
ncbi:MAG: family 16 glycosylhydrolase, partial [Actinomycetes bacterium]